MSSSLYFKVFTQRNSAVLLLLGFASGLPLALTSGTLQAWMTVENVDLETIGFFSLVGQAYVFKFLWSPLMDRYTPPFMGRRRGWLLITQLLLIGSLFAMGWFTPSEHLWELALLATLTAFLSASQDTVFDAYKTDLLAPEERGSGAAISVLGYRLAMLVSGGLALWIATRWLNWQQTYWLMAGLLLLSMLGTLMAKEPRHAVPTPKSLQDAVILPLREFFGRDNAWLILLLLVFYKLGDAFAGSLSTTFLIRGVGFSADEVGLVNKSLGLVATIIGALYGGLLMQHLSLHRALLVFGGLQAISNFGYWALAVTNKNILTMGAAILVENLCGGMGTAAFVALLMTLCNLSFSATQFALLSALSAVGRVYVGPVAGWFVKLYDWPLFYLFSVIAALPGLLLLLICQRSLEYTQKTGRFLPRSQFARQYTQAVRLLCLGIGSVITYFVLKPFCESEETLWLLWGGLSASMLAIAVGAILDYLAVRHTQRV